MNDVPPPLTPQPSPNPYQGLQQQPQFQPDAPKSGSGRKWFFGCGCGCLGLLLILAIVGYFLSGWVKTQATDLIGGYTATEPVKIEMLQLSPAEIEQSVGKFSAFQAGLATGATPVPLVLSGQDINALIQHHPSFKALADRASVTVEESTLRSQVSLNLDDIEIPVPFLAEAVKGRYFNGVATFSLGMAAGRPALYIEGLEVNGAEIPSQFMTEFSKQNLFEDAGKDPEIAAMVERIEDIRIENGELTIVPKAAP